MIIHLFPCYTQGPTNTQKAKDEAPESLRALFGTGIKLYTFWTNYWKFFLLPIVSFSISFQFDFFFCDVEHWYNNLYNIRDLRIQIIADSNQFNSVKNQPNCCLIDSLQPHLSRLFYPSCHRFYLKFLTEFYPILYFFKFQNNFPC